MASKLLFRSWKSLPTKAVAARCSSAAAGAAHNHGVAEIYHEDRSIIGRREVVGFGVNGMANYADRVDYPFPAIRWQEEDSTIKALREKEKGDWRKLTIAEKKALYRFNFRQTIAEATASTGEWKSVFGWTMIGVGISFWCSIALWKWFLPELPETFSLERRQAQLLRVLDSNMYPVTGISRDWDHEKRRWKEN